MGTTQKIYDTSLERDLPPEVELDDLGHRQTIDRIIRVYVKSDEQGRSVAVTHHESIYETGVRVDTGTRWFRWSSSRRIVRLTKTGRMLYVSLGRSKEPAQSFVIDRIGSRGNRSDLVDAKNRRLHAPARLVDAVVEHLGRPKSFRDCYPLVSHFPDLGSDTDPTFRARFEDVTDIKALVESLYGKKSVRKSLVKAVAQTDLWHLYLSWCLRGRHVPVDWHVDFLRKHPRHDGIEGEYPALRLRGFRPHLRHLDKSSVRRLMRADDVPRLVVDLCRMRPSGRVTQVRSWAELHDRAAVADRVIRAHEILMSELKEQRATERSRRRHARLLEDPAYLARMEAAERERALREAEAERRRLEEIGERARVYDETAKAVGGRTSDGVEVVVADDAATLLTWGEQMGQCIASYTSALHDRSSLLLGLYRSGDLIANAEIRVDGNSGSRLVQLLGKRNATLPQEDIDDVLPHFTGAGVDLPTYWVGQPRRAA